MSDRIPGLITRGGPAPSPGPVPANSVRGGAPTGAESLHSGFVRSPRLITPESRFQGGEDKADRVNSPSGYPYTRHDSGIYSSELSSLGSIESQMQYMSLTGSRQSQAIPYPTRSAPAPTSNNRVRRPLAGQAKTTRIVEMSKINNGGTVQAPSMRSTSPLLTYSSSQPSLYGHYPSSYTPNATTHQYRSADYNTQPHSYTSFDVQSMLHENLQFFMQDKEGDTGLHLAVIHSRPDLLDRLLYLVTKEPMLQTVVDEQNTLYQTALHLAVHTQQIDMIRKLLLAGASLNVPDHKGNTALHIAAQFSSTKSLEELALYVPMQTLLEVATTRNNEGLTCVHIAAKHGNTDVLRKLKSYGVNIDMQDHKSGKTALHLSVENSCLRDVQFLLETCHANVNAATFTGCTSLHIAAGRGDISTAAYLLSQGANPELLTDEGDTALEIAGSEEVVSLLTKAAALKWMY